VYFDIETDPHGGDKLCWLVGVLDEASGEFVQHLAQTPLQEGDMLEEFARFCATLDGRYLVSYSGSNFDHRNVSARMRALGIPVPSSLENAVDLLYPVRRAIALPCTGYGLKNVAGCLGFIYRHRDVDGFTVALEYLRLARERRRIPRRFLEYNEDDVRALQHVVAKVEEMAGSGGWPVPRISRKRRANPVGQTTS
jgi:predicted RecB family nuclease